MFIFDSIIYRYEAPIDTAHQLAEKNLEWGATHDAWIFSILEAKQVSLFRILLTFVLPKKIQCIYQFDIYSVCAAGFSKIGETVSSHPI